MITKLLKTELSRNFANTYRAYDDNKEPIKIVKIIKVAEKI